VIEMKNTILSIDPGREKCGVAVVSRSGILAKQVVATTNLLTEIGKLCDCYPVDVIIMGNGTTSKTMQIQIKDAFPDLPLQICDEYRTTDAAKIRYWQENPPHGWKRLLPTTMQVPPDPVDDYAAVILAERYFIKNS
jgi:RNase H-fold protein (predicted Holliday junction resolvase)